MFLPSFEPSIDEEMIFDAVREAQKGDELSFITLYHWYYTQINRHLLRIIGNTEDAADLAQETFSKAWYGLGRVCDVKRFRGWLYQIATNTALDHLRRKRREQGYWINPYEEGKEEPEINFDNGVEEQEMVQLALARVATKPRACLLLHLDGFSQEEIAAFVGLQKTSVGTYISTARKQFRKAYYQLENL